MIADAFHCRFNTGRETKEQRYRQKLIDQGLCAWCRKPRERAGRYCENCRESHRINSQARRASWSRMGTVGGEMSEKFYGDVVYDVWRSGGNPDAVGRERVDSAEYGGATAEEVAVLELRLQRARAAVERDMREWEANEWDLPANERLSR